MVHNKSMGTVELQWNHLIRYCTQAGAEVCQARVKLGLAKPAIAS